MRLGVGSRCASQWPYNAPRSGRACLTHRARADHRYHLSLGKQTAATTFGGGAMVAVLASLTLTNVTIVDASYRVDPSHIVYSSDSEGRLFVYMWGGALLTEGVPL